MCLFALFAVGIGILFFKIEIQCFRNFTFILNLQAYVDQYGQYGQSPFVERERASAKSKSNNKGFQSA